MSTLHNPSAGTADQERLLEDEIKFLEEQKRVLEQRIYALSQIYQRLMEKTLGSSATEGIEILKLAEQYKRTIDALKTFNFSLDGVPSLEALETFFAPKVDLIQKNLTDPRLILVPPCTFEESIAKLNEFGVTQQIYADDIYQALHKISQQWQAFFIDGTQEMDVANGDDRFEALGERVRKYKQQLPEGIGGVSREQYLMLAMQGIKERQIFDRETWTILAGDSVMNESLVPSTGWRVDRVSFSWFHVRNEYSFARFRSSVGGDVVS